MALKVIIHRKVSGGNNRRVQELLIKMRTLCLSQPGYIGGETLHELADPDGLVVISSWGTHADWSRWYESEARRSVEAEFATLLREPAALEVLQQTVLDADVTPQYEPG